MVDKRRCDRCRCVFFEDEPCPECGPPERSGATPAPEPQEAAPEPVQEPPRAKHPLPSLDPYVQEFREKYGRAAQTEFYPECDDRE